MEVVEQIALETQDGYQTNEDKDYRAGRRPHWIANCPFLPSLDKVGRRDDQDCSPRFFPLVLYLDEYKRYVS